MVIKGSIKESIKVMFQAGANATEYLKKIAEQFTRSLRASLETTFYHEICIFPWENELIFLDKMKIP
jgi:hypothetical protein